MPLALWRGPPAGPSDRTSSCRSPPRRTSRSSGTDACCRRRSSHLRAASPPAGCSVSSRSAICCSEASSSRSMVLRSVMSRVVPQTRCSMPSSTMPHWLRSMWRWLPSRPTRGDFHGGESVSGADGVEVGLADARVGEGGQVVDAPAGQLAGLLEGRTAGPGHRCIPPDSRTGRSARSAAPRVVRWRWAARIRCATWRRRSAGQTPGSAVRSREGARSPASARVRRRLAARRFPVSISRR